MKNNKKTVEEALVDTLENLEFYDIDKIQDYMRDSVKYFGISVYPKKTRFKAILSKIKWVFGLRITHKGE